MKKHLTMYALEGAGVLAFLLIWGLTDAPRYALMAAGCWVLLGTEGIA